MGPLNLKMKELRAEHALGTALAIGGAGLIAWKIYQSQQQLPQQSNTQLQPTLESETRAGQREQDSMNWFRHSVSQQGEVAADLRSSFSSAKDTLRKSLDDGQDSHWLQKAQSAMLQAEKEESNQMDGSHSRLPVVPKTICIVAPPGAGKSTVLKVIQSEGFDFIMSPDDEIFGEYLKTVYTDMHRWAFTFQLECLDWYHHVRAAIPVLQRNSEYVFVEHSVETQRSCFVRQFHENGSVTEWEHNLLYRMWD